MFPRLVGADSVTDVVDPATRTQMMSGIGGRNTKPEILVRKALFVADFRFRLRRNDLPCHYTKGRKLSGQRRFLDSSIANAISAI